jgi:alkylation response protein AidB-like acyl-CoA dehydrogenase
LPPGAFGGLYLAAAHLPLTFSATFLGLMGQAYEYAIAYLTGEVDGAPGAGASNPATRVAVADMLLKVETSQALFYRSISQAKLAPNTDIIQRARAAHVTIQRAVVEVTQEAMRVCGGRGTLKRFPLERYARDACAAAVMRPWTQGIALENLWETVLGIKASDE